MSLLQLKQDVPGGDRNAPGEDYAKGTSYLLMASIIAFVLISVGITVFLFMDHKPPPAVGEVTQAWIHPVHTVTSPVDANGNPTIQENFDQVLVFAQVRVRNQSDQAIVLKNMETNVTLRDGIHTSYAATPTDYDRIFIAYPELAGLRSKPLTSLTVIQPGQVLEGMIVSAFHVSKELWSLHDTPTFTLEFKYHPSLVLTPKTDPIQQ